jgi:hypothetical protein
MEAGMPSPLTASRSYRLEARLTEAAGRLLEALAVNLGLSKTATMELAIRRLAKAEDLRLDD